VAAREYLDTLKVGHSIVRRSWKTSSFVWRPGSTWTPSTPQGRSFNSQEVLDDVIIRVAAREYLNTLKVGHSTDDNLEKIPFLPVLWIRIRTGSGFSGVPGSESKRAIVTQKN